MCVCHPITHLTYDDHHQFDPHPTVQDFSIVLCLFLWELEQCFYKYPPIYQIMIISPTDFPQFVFPVFSHSNSEEPEQEASKPAGWSDRKSALPLLQLSHPLLGQTQSFILTEYSQEEQEAVEVKASSFELLRIYFATPSLSLSGQGLAGLAVEHARSMKSHCR